jgi:hypothetical protein
MNKILTVNEIVICPICRDKFKDESSQIPKILPCGKSVCLSCISEMKSNNYAIKCKLCLSEHRIPRCEDLPTNEILLILINSANSIEANNYNNNNNSILNTTKLVSILKNDNEQQRKKVDLILKEIDLNTEKLDASIKNSRANLSNHFDSIEKEINTRTDELINDLNKTRNSLLKQLDSHRNSAFNFFDQGIEENSNLLMKSKQNYDHALAESKSAREKNEIEISKLVIVVKELNQQIYQTLVYFENLVRDNLQFVKSVNSIDSGALIGCLDLKKTNDQENFALKTIKYNENKQSVNIVPLSSRHSCINYKIPINVKNFFIIILSNKTILKATETAPVDDGFNYNMKIQIKNLDGLVLCKLNENINSNRIKRIQVCNSNHYVTVLLKNRFLDNYTLSLYNNELIHIRSIDLHYKPDELFMNDTGIYVKPFLLHPSFIHKYNYKLEHIKSIGQCIDDNKLFYFSKSFKLIAFEKEKLFFIDLENFKIKIMNELNGRVCKSISLNETNNILVQIDSLNERVNVLNIKHYFLYVYDWDGLFLFKKKIDTKIESIDYFYFLNDEKFSIVDQKNSLIYFF